MHEYERRVELVYRAASADALRDLTKDLAQSVPVRVTQAPVASQAEASVPARSSRAKNFFALMSGVLRKGTWTVPTRIRAVAVMGGISLDLRQASLSGPVTDIYVFAMMGGVEIIVPPDVRLESDGFAIMGGFEDQLKEPASRDPGAPVVRVHGFAFMGGVEARVATLEEKEKSAD